MRLDHVGLMVKQGELEQVADFYKKLGFQIYKTTNFKGWTEYMMGHELDKSCQIDLHQVPPGAEHTPVHHFAILVDDGERIYEQLKSKGVNVGPPPVRKHSGRKNFMVEGPYGVLIQYSEEMLLSQYVEDFAKR